MDKNTYLPPEINPEARYSYFDVVQVKIPKLLDADADYNMRSRLGELCRRGLHVRRSRTAKHSVIRMYQPTSKALRFWKGKDAYVSYLEITKDDVFDTRDALREISAYLRPRLVKKYHGKQRTNDDRGTLYTGPKGAPNVIVTYDDLPCKLTGAAHCLHLEWRASGKEAVKRLGISHPSDLLEFDHRGFWAKHLYLVEVDWEVLDKRYREACRCVLRRTFPQGRPKVIRRGKFQYDPYDRARHILKRRYYLCAVADGSAQTIVDKLRLGSGRRDYLIAVDPAPFLPSSTRTSLLI